MFSPEYGSCSDVFAGVRAGLKRAKAALGPLRQGLGPQDPDIDFREHLFHTLGCIKGSHGRFPKGQGDCAFYPLRLVGDESVGETGRPFFGYVYHMPDDAYYDATHPEECFATP